MTVDAAISGTIPWKWIYDERLHIICKDLVGCNYGHEIEIIRWHLNDAIYETYIDKPFLGHEARYYLYTDVEDSGNMYLTVFLEIFSLWHIIHAINNSYFLKVYLYLEHIPFFLLVKILIMSIS